jgi:hypothetical protein
MNGVPAGITVTRRRVFSLNIVQRLVNVAYEVD